MYFILFIAFALLLSVSYALGRKKNLKKIKSVGKTLEEIIKPSDQNYTWLGGTIGFRANYKSKSFVKVEATLTLLPRQSPLYYPVSFLVSGFDRLYMTFFLKPELTSEGHILNSNYFKFRGPIIENIDTFSKKDIHRNGKKFFILYQNEGIKKTLLNFFEEIEKENLISILKHIALVPDKNTLFFLIEPKNRVWEKFGEKIYSFALKEKF